MSRINIAPIVEGHGDDAAVRILLQRVWTEIVGGDYAEIRKPIRQSRGKLLKRGSDALERAVNFAFYRLAEVGGGLVLVLVDAEDDCATLGPLGPLLLQRAQAARRDADIACVIANIMYETWFVAAVESLEHHLNLPPSGEIPEDPERAKCGKGWIKKHMKTAKYSETVDQARLTSAMDLELCRNRSRSFDKLCRELEARMPLPEPPLE